MTDEELKQIAAWYRDPVRNLPRKVVRDVAMLVQEVENLQSWKQGAEIGSMSYKRSLPKRP